MASLIAQCTFKIVNVSQQRCPGVCFDKVAIIATLSEFLRQKVSHLLNKNLYIKFQGNLSKPQRKALVQRKNNKDTTIYSFDQGSEFVAPPEKNTI